jgi:hypothetical protein
MKKQIFTDLVFVVTVNFLLITGSLLFVKYKEVGKISKEDLDEYIATELNLNNDFNLEKHVVVEAKTIDETVVKAVAPPIEEKVLTDDLQSKAYNIGYKNGQRAMYVQMNMQVNEEEKVTEYTSLEESEEIKSEEDKKKIEEIIQKGYVDGYHRASESFSCPRSY